MGPAPVSLLLRTWYKWKSLRFPWRKRFLVGLDLHGNTYWEFRLTNGSGPDGRWRRIVQYPRKTHHGDVSVSPAWHQWLRNTRKEPPSLDEQKADVARQERMKVLAAQADARWAAKPSLLGSDQTSAPAPALGNGKGEEGDSREETWKKMQRDAQQDGRKGQDPWKQQAPSGLSEQWQPKAWQQPKK
ncbi:hypothetical protein B0T16DRAFT_458091 [Cercophora newfieldiana]|uniref:NADH dehydrogenase [ubiquinone] 1 alpha subcomplex subunit n=1 Tax=Cercophora newfieldiana TaxID=92897 RepID=A0AA39Y780_9PEZI|nr:hypothetical protein B0T16DRAFT_458091 [Cercophora newfieldiana]